jgi:hypothetical protein
MNERIKLLAEQANLEIDPAHPDHNQKVLEKFAELIVQECMNIVENHPIDPEDMPYNMRIIPYMIEVQEKMKLHFGVEE